VPRRVSKRFAGLSAVEASARRLLRRLLLGPDGPDQAMILPIAGVDGEQYADDLAVAAGKLEVIGAPANIRAQGDHDAVVRAR
jgi:hypothetical protein